MDTADHPQTPSSSRKPVCVEADAFWASIDTVRPTVFASSRDLRLQLDNIKEVLSNTDNDWEKRSDALRRLRSCITPSAIQYFHTDFRLASQLQVPLQRTLRDLRSQIIREACITVAYMSYKLGQQHSCGFDLLAENLINPLLSLIQNSAKIMANSSVCAICFMIEYTESTRLINPILCGLSSKSKDIRRYTCEFIYRILSTWQVSTLSRYSSQLQEAIKSGIEDADVDARMHSRNSYVVFKQYFPGLADMLLNSLDSGKKKILKDGSEGCNTPATVRRCTTPGVQNSRIRRAITPRPLGSSSTVRSKTPCANRSVTSSSSLKPNGISSISQPASRANSPLRVARCKTPATSTNKSIPAYPSIRSREVSPSSRTSTLKYRTRKMKEDNVAASETSSVSSDRPVSRKIGTSQYSIDVRQNSNGSGKHSCEVDPAQMLALMVSTAWTDKYEGLMILQKFIDLSGKPQQQTYTEANSKGFRSLSKSEIQRACDQMVKMFSDAHGKVYNLFLDVMFDFIGTFYNHLSEWTLPLLSGLLTKISTESAVSTASLQKIQSCVDLMRKRFPLDRQFWAAMQILSIDDNPSVKMKLAVLRFLDNLLGDMQSADVPPATVPEMLLGTAAIIRMTGDRKSSELRKLSQRVLFSFAQMNNAEFMTILSKLPREFRLAASSYVMDSRTRPNCINFDKSLDDAFNQCNATLRKSIKRATTPIYPNENGNQSGSQRLRPITHRSPVSNLYKCAAASTTLPRNTPYVSLSRIPKRSKSRCDFSLPPQSSAASSSAESSAGGGAIHSAIASGTSTVVLELTGNDKVNALAQEMDSKLSLRSAGTSSSSSTGLKLTNWTSSTNHQASGHTSAFTTSVDGPTSNAVANKRSITSADHVGVIGSVIYQISRQDNPVESRYHHMQCLLSMISAADSANAGWTQHFDTVLFLVIRILFEPYVLLQTIALNILQWMLCNQPDRFDNCNELTVVRLLEFQRDQLSAQPSSTTAVQSSSLLIGSIPTHADLMQALDDTITTAAVHLPLGECFQVLRPIIETSESTCMTLSAIRMLDTMITKRMTSTEAMSLIDPLVSSLLVAWSNEQSSVRKASVFCLVSLHKLVGRDAMNPHLADLPPSKLKLLNVYIDRSTTSGSVLNSGMNSNGSINANKLVAK
ncbi:hypothetical protein ACOME3_003547 [Neoechinorhynchus agilis]